MAPEAPEDRQWVVIARVTGPRGNRGEVEALSLSSRPGRFCRLSEVYLFDPQRPAAECRPVVVNEVWQHRGRTVFKFQGVDTISEAEGLRGLEVRIPLSARPPLQNGEYYQSDLIGCEVVERLSGRLVGRVTDWREYGGSVLLVVEGAAGEEILIPFAGAICVEIDVARRRLTVDLPEGLRDLNR